MSMQNPQQTARTDRAARYLALAEWARARYATAGTLVLSVGGEPSAYSRVEQAAWRRYMEQVR